MRQMCCSVLWLLSVACEDEVTVDKKILPKSKLELASPQLALDPPPATAHHCDNPTLPTPPHCPTWVSTISSVSSHQAANHESHTTAVDTTAAETRIANTDIIIALTGTETTRATTSDDTGTSDTVIATMTTGRDIAKDTGAHRPNARRNATRK